MNRLQGLLALAASLPMVATPAHASLVDAPVRGEVHAFSAGLVDDEILRSAVATGSRSFAHSLQRISDAEAIITAQEFGQNSRIALDGWWSQTGALLIANNLIVTYR